MTAAAVTARGLAVGYGQTVALEQVDFEVGEGRMVGVLGPNGGGKTTLFRGIAGELAPLAGEVTVGGRIAHVAQTDRTRLDFPVTAHDVALMGALARGRWWLPSTRRDRAAAHDALARVGLADQAKARFGALSGGQRQRTLIARALVQDAPVLLLDEPLAGVDPASAQTIERLFASLRDEGRTLLIATHDIESARACDLVLCVNGRQIAFGAPAEVLDRTALEATYESEIVVLDDGPAATRAITVQHHDHH